MKFLATAAAAAALAAGLIGCSSSHPAPPRAARPSTAAATSAASPPRVSPSAAADNGGFCADARALGLEQRISLNDGSSKVDASLLPKLDALAAEAPAEIRPDFTLFVKIEHALLGGGTPDPAVLQQIDQPGTEARLAHVRSYLDQQCGTGAA